MAVWRCHHCRGEVFPRRLADDAVVHEVLWWCHDGHRAVRVGDHKLVAAKDEPWELYDLATDRSETTDLAAEMPGRVGELEAAWSRIAEECRKLATDPDPAGPSESEGDRG